MNPDTVKSIQEALTPIAEKIGEGAAHLYEIYVRQIVIESWVHIAVASLLLLLVIGALVSLPFVYRSGKATVDRLNKKGDYHRDRDVSDTWQGAYLVIVPIVCVITAGFATAGLSRSVIALNNPEYYAIERLVDQVRN